MNTDVLTDLSKRFLFHADIYSGKTPENSSPLYAHLARCVAQDEEILQLLIQADRATQVSNLLFGATHYLLLQGVNHPLSQYYASITENPRPVEDAFTDFQAFCRQYADSITDIVIRKRVQTNEVQRCTALVPAFHLVQQRHNKQPLAIIEIGASIGLLLQWDKYHYDYGQVGAIQTNSEVNLFCHVIGIQTPPLPMNVPEVGYRIGIDLHPVNVNDKDAVQWVRALIWPEHTERARTFTQAVTITRKHPPRIVAGNAAEHIRGMIQSIPPNHTICIFHSYTLNQCPPDIRERVIAGISASSAIQNQPISRVSLEWFGGQAQPHLELFTHTKEDMSRELLAYCESHGRAIEWL